MKHLLRFAIIGSLAAPHLALAQSWEIDARRVSIDHDPQSSFIATGEHVPDVWGIAARCVTRHNLFVEAEYSSGTDHGAGAICGGFILDPDRQCVRETVRYSGRLSAISLGWAGRRSIGSHWSIGIRPKLGVGEIHVSESGRDSGTRHAETRQILTAGAAAEAIFRTPESGLGLVMSIEATGIQPKKQACFDCRQIFWTSLPQVAYGVGFTWKPARGP